MTTLFFHIFKVFTGCGDATARVFDAKSGSLKRTLAGHEFAINAIQVEINLNVTPPHKKTVVDLLCVEMSRNFLQICEFMSVQFLDTTEAPSTFCYVLQGVLKLSTFVNFFNCVHVT